MTGGPLKFRTHLQYVVYSYDNWGPIWTIVSYPLTNFEEHFGLRAPIIFQNSNICGFLFIWTLSSSQTLVVNWQN